MVEFLELEAVYIALGVFAVTITIIVTTRDFMPKGAFKKGVSSVAVISSLLVFGHYYNTTSRMDNTERLFNEGKTIICENKMHRTISQSVLVDKDANWILEDHLFKHEDMSRDFHTSRCIEWVGPDAAELGIVAPPKE
ncbi:MAG: hypothetical protein WC144_04230 [Sulfurimonas sp.]|jgi:hypothetical protein|nr:hypothetical protein [Sulfurimonadaceae bacterium]